MCSIEKRSHLVINFCDYCHEVSHIYYFKYVIISLHPEKIKIFDCKIEAVRKIINHLQCIHTRVLFYSLGARTDTHEHYRHIHMHAHFNTILHIVFLKDILIIIVVV